MDTRIFLYKEKHFAFSFNKSDIKTVFDKKVICELIRIMYHTNCIHYDFDIEELDEILSEINFNHVAFFVKNQDLAYFSPVA
ncbi:hypothetical protein [Bacillus bombysepticus]|uniref:hypothetical protein n=1 Tax=Bacillus bombysepticus TaxID=658666 RepID=UPI003019E801